MGRLTKRLTKFHHALGQRVIGDYYTRPHGGEQFIARDDFASMGGEVFQYSHGLVVDTNDYITTLDTITARFDDPVI